MQVEVCANSLESALNAQRGGADRIELCSALGMGGITPSYGLLKTVKEHLTIPVHVLIRPRGGDFTYSDTEFDGMKRDVELCVDLGFEGIVSGVLYKDFSLDEDRTAQLMKASGNLKFTFHRAFDWVGDPFDTLDRLETLGVDYILSSGQQKSALDGIELLSELHQKTSKCVIMPGSGVGIGNIESFKEKGFGAIHLSGTKAHRNITGTPKISMAPPQVLPDGLVLLTDAETIRQVVSCVK